MRKISPISFACLLWLVPAALCAAEKLRLGDFPTEAEKKEDERLRKKRLLNEDAPLPAPPPVPSVPEAPMEPAVEKIPEAPAKPAAPKPLKTKRAAPRAATKPIESKEKSQELYLRALTASQNGDFDAALGFCREALKHDPSNLQAERMRERLESRGNQ